MTPERAIGYARVYSKEQEQKGFSIPVQMKRTAFWVVTACIGFWLGWSVKAVSLGFDPMFLYSFITMLATVVVAWATVKYVRLTHELVKQGENRDMAAQRQEARILYATCQRLSEILEELPTEVNQGQIKRVAMWESQEIEYLTLTVPRFDGANATLVVNDLRWLKDRVDEMMAGKNTVGGVNSPFSTEEWAMKLVGGRVQVKNLMESCTKYLGAFDRLK